MLMNLSLNYFWVLWNARRYNVPSVINESCYEAIKDAYFRRDNVSISPSAQYFFDDYDRVAA